MKMFIPPQHRKRLHLAAAVSAVTCLLSSTSALPQEPASGQQAFNNACRTCHIMREGDNRLGPNLNKVVGRKAGSISGYNYSSAMKETDFVWDEAKLDRFIANPDEVVPGHNMKPYGGLASKEERTKIIAFLAESK